jgi:hypothetical protein
VRKKLIALAFALTASAAALGLFSPRPVEAATCRGTLICCPNQPCFCCKNPCLVVCDSGF